MKACDIMDQGTADHPDLGRGCIGGPIFDSGNLLLQFGGEGRHPLFRDGVIRAADMPPYLLQAPI